jgi:outer membrane lipoprotein carrier protein
VNPIKYLFSLCLILWSLALSAGQGPEQMARFLDGVNTLEARFEQSVLDPEHQNATRSQGVFYLERPGRFRWDYSEPENQQIIADGSQIWLFEPELEQVSVQSQSSALKGTPALLLISGEPVEKHFEVIDIGDRQGMGWVELIPRDQESQFTRILLAFVDDELRRMEMADKFGQITRFQFYDISSNPVFTEGFFRFEPPWGVDIFRQD